MSQQGEVDSCSTNSEYFPPVERMGAISGFPFGQDQITWESDFLRRMHEPSLFSCGNQQEATYRFLWDRSMSSPIAARMVVHSAGTGTLFVRMLANAGIPPPPEKGEKTVSADEWYKLTLEREIPLTQWQVSHAVALYQKMPFRDETNKGMTTDGSDWIFESKINGAYRLVDFRNCNNQAATDFGKYPVIGLGGIKIPSGGVYY